MLPTSTHRSELAAELRKYESNLNQKWAKAFNPENNSWTLEFGQQPEIIKIEVEIAIYNEIVATITQNDGHEILEPYQVMRLENLIYSEALELRRSIPKFAHSIYNFLYKETHKDIFLDLEYSDMIDIQKQYEATFGPSWTEIETPKPSEPDNSSDDSSDNSSSSKLTEVERLYRFAIQLADSGDDHLKISHYRGCIEYDACDIIRKFKKRVSSAGGLVFSKLDIDRCGKQFIDELINLSRNDYNSLTWTYNGLQYVPEDVSKLYKLNEVNLGFNKLNFVPASLFQLPLLKKLSLGYNQLKSLPPISGCPLLEYLDCQHNQISYLPEDLHLLPLLSAIVMDYNQIREIPTNFAYLKKLSHLSLSNNQIKHAPSCLANCPNLTYLKLFGNPVSNIPESVIRAGSDSILAHLSESATPHICDSSFTHELSKYASSEEYTDIVLKTRTGKMYPAHRIVLAARSPAFYSSIIKHERPKKGAPQSELQYDDQGRLIFSVLGMDDESLVYFKRYLYTDSFVLADQIPEISSSVPKTFDEEREQQQQIVKKSRVIKKIQRLAEGYNMNHLAYLAAVKLNPDIPAVPTQFIQDFKVFHSRATLSDISISANDTQSAIPAHKVILVARSEYFKTMFSTGMKEAKTNVALIPEISHPVLISILGYCYSDDVDIHSDTAVELLIKSKLFGLERMGAIVETVVGYSLDIENATYLYTISRTYGFEKLKNNVVSFIMSNRARVLCSAGWKELSEEEKSELNKIAKDWNLSK